MKYNRDQRREMRHQPTGAPSPTASQGIGAESSTEDEATGPIFFWREFEEPYGFMCQWYTSFFTDPSTHPTHTFNCGEQYMMYRKALVLATLDHESEPDPAATPHTGKRKGKQPKKAPSSQRAKITLDQEDRAHLPAMIIAESKPRKQKGLARSIKFTPYQLTTWETAKFDIVCQGTYCKFTQNLDLKRKLLETGERELLEASPMDRVWGIGFIAEVAEMHRKDWGSNLLGKALMSVRERLNREEEEEEEQNREGRI